MPKIVDPDALNRGVELIIDTTVRTIKVVGKSEDVLSNVDDTGPGRDNGVTEQAVFSKLKELWLSESDLNKLKFPFDAITPDKMDLVFGWDWEGDTTKRLIRDGGWSLRDAAGNMQESYFAFVSLGAFDDPDEDRAYYQQALLGVTTNTEFIGDVNEPVKVFGDETHGNFDFRNFFTAFLREQGKLYSIYNLIAEQNVPEIDYKIYQLPLANSIDLKIATSDSDIDTLAPYTGMTVEYRNGNGFTTWATETAYVVDDVVLDTVDGRWYRATSGHTSGTGTRADDAVNWESYPGEFLIGDTWRAFNRIVRGNGGTAEQIYEWAQRQLRIDDNINEIIGEGGTFDTTGKTAQGLLRFVGDTLVTEPGVYVDSFDPNDTNRITFNDIGLDGGGLNANGTPVTSSSREFPFVAAGTLLPNSVLQGDPAAEITVYFLSTPGGDFDTTNAIIVEDNNGNPMTFGPGLGSSIPFTFDYDGNDQGGRTPGTNATIVVTFGGTGGAQRGTAEFTITRSVGLNFPINGILERNYRGS